MRLLHRAWFRIAFALFGALLLTTGIAHAAKDQAVLTAAQQVKPDVVKQLKHMVLIESGSQQTDGLAAMADYLQERLQALGLTVQRQPATAGPGADIIVATLKGTGSADIMLQAHMDTVYDAEILKTQPYKVEGNRIYGPGIADDKGGLAVILGLLQMIKNTGWQDFDTLTVLMNPDEEIGSPGSNALLTQLGSEADVVLSFEPTIAKAVLGKHVLVLGTAGVGIAKLTVKGKASHAGNAPEKGRNALYELAHQMLQTRNVADDIDGATLSWTAAQTDGNPPNQIPASAHALGDVRIKQPGAEQALVAALEKKVGGSQLVRDTQVSVEVDMHRPMLHPSDASRALAKQAQAIYQELGMDLALAPMIGGGTDAAFAALSGNAAVLESLGLAGAGYHAKDEYIEVDSIVPRLYLAMRLLQKVGK